MITNELELKTAFNQLDKLIAEMGEDANKQAQAKQLAEAIQIYEKKYVSFPLPTAEEYLAQERVNLRE